MTNECFSVLVKCTPFNVLSSCSILVNYIEFLFCLDGTPYQCLNPFMQDQVPVPCGREGSPKGTYQLPSAVAQQYSLVLSMTLLCTLK